MKSYFLWTLFTYYSRHTEKNRDNILNVNVDSGKKTHVLVFHKNFCIEKKQSLIVDSQTRFFGNKEKL